MDPPEDLHPMFHLEGLILARNADGSLCQPAPPLFSIQTLQDADFHDLPQGPQHIDDTQPFHTFNTHTSENSEQARLVEELQKAQEAYNALLTSAHDLDQRVKEVDEESQDARRECAVVASDLADAMEQVRELREALKSYKDDGVDLDNLRRKIDALSEANRQLGIDAEGIEQRNTEISRLKSALDASERKAEQLGKDLRSERDSEIQKLQSEVADLMPKAHQTTETLKKTNDLNMQLAASRVKVGGLEGRVKTLQDENGRLQQENTKLHESDTRISGLNTKISTLEDVNTQLEKDVNELRDEKNKLQEGNTTVSGLRSDILALEEKNTQLEKDIKRLRDELQEGNTTASDLRSKISTLEDVNTQLEKDVNELRDEKNKLQEGNTAVSGLRSDILALKDKNKQLEKDANDLRDEKKKLGTDHEKLGTAHDELVTTHDELVTAHDELVTAHEELRKTNDELGTAHEELRKTHDELGTAHKELRKTRDNLCKDHEKLVTDHDNLVSKNDELTKEVEQAVRKGADAVKEFTKLDAEMVVVNKTKAMYLENYLSLRGTIRVNARFRGPEDYAKSEDVLTEVTVHGNGALLQIGRKEQRSLAVAGVSGAEWKKKAWALDQVFTAAHTNADIWEEIRPLLESAQDGAQVCIPLFGRTGTGKSHTSDGIWHHFIDALFKQAKDDSSVDGEAGAAAQEYTFWATEVYMGELYDLLKTAKDMKGRKLELPNHTSGPLDPVKDCRAQTVTVSNEESMRRVLKQAVAARTSSQTLANDASSRGHGIFCLVFPSGGSTILCDLAGHEKDSVSDNRAETVAINKSLQALTECFGKLMGLMGKAGRPSPKPKKGKNTPPKKNTPSGKPQAAGPSTPARPTTNTGNVTPARDVTDAWKSSELLPRVVGAMMLRGRDDDQRLQLKAKVMFMATLDCSTEKGALSAEATLDSLRHAGLIPSD